MNGASKRTPSILETLREDWHQLGRVSGAQRPLRPWHFLHPRFLHVVLIRLALGMRAHGWIVTAKFFSMLLYLAYRVELNTRATIGPGLVIPHPMGIVIGAHEVGARSLIYQNVTLGAKTPDVAYAPARRPHVGDDVTIGSGAVVVGGIRIGDGAIVAANSLVTRDVPPGLLAVGVPAQLKVPRTQVGPDIADTQV